MAQLPYGRGTHVGPDAFHRQQESLAQREGAVAKADGGVLDLRSALLNRFGVGELQMQGLNQLYFIPLAPLERGYTISHARICFYAGTATSEVHAALYARRSRYEYAVVGATKTAFYGDAAGTVTNQLTEPITFPAESQLAMGILGLTALVRAGAGSQRNDFPFPLKMVAATSLPSIVRVESLSDASEERIPWITYISAEVAELY